MGSDENVGASGLSFEQSGRRRHDAKPELARMYRVPQNRAGLPAFGPRFERGVRLHLRERIKKRLHA